jgi:hypothetical protein
MTMTTATISITNPGTPSVDRSPATAEALGLELIDIHRQAGPLVAELSTGPAWADADGITARLITEAEVIATRAAPAEPVTVPAVVRCRELAAAQRRMVLALEDDDRFDVAEAAVVRARALLAELVELTDGPRATLRR